MRARKPQDDPFRFGRRRLTISFEPESRDVRMPFVEVDRDEERVYVTVEFFDGTERDAKLVVEATEVRIENLPTVLGSHRIALPVAVDAHRAEERRRNAVVTLEIPRASEGASGKA